jgi:hypothetical protein
LDYLCYGIWTANHTGLHLENNTWELKGLEITADEEWLKELGIFIPQNKMQ